MISSRVVHAHQSGHVEQSLVLCSWTSWTQLRIDLKPSLRFFLAGPLPAGCPLGDHFRFGAGLLAYVYTVATGTGLDVSFQCLSADTVRLTLEVSGSSRQS